MVGLTSRVVLQPYFGGLQLTTPFIAGRGPPCMFDPLIAIILFGNKSIPGDSFRDLGIFFTGCPYSPNSFPGARPDIYSGTLELSLRIQTPP